MKNKRLLSSLSFLPLLFITLPAFSADNYKLEAWTLNSSGSSDPSNTNSISETLTGRYTGQDYILRVGFIYFLQDISPPAGAIKINDEQRYTNSTSVTITISAQDNRGGSGLSQMSFSNDNKSWSTPQPYSTTKIWALTSGDGEKTVWAKFSDKAGNWSTTVIKDDIILDTTAPFVDIQQSSNPYIKTKDYLLSGTKSADAPSITLEVSPAVVVKGPITYTSTTWQCQLSNLSEGTIGLNVYCKDLAGNSSPIFTSSLLVDTTVPSTPQLTTQIPILINQPTLSFQGTKEANSSIWINSQEAGIIEAVGIDRYQSWNCPYTLKEGQNRLSIFSKDYAGNQSAALNLPTIMLDTQPPAAPVVNNIISPTNNPRCLLQGAKEANSSVWVNNKEAVALNTSVTWSYLLSLFEGMNNLNILSKDAAGNASAIVSRTIILDTMPPPLPAINPVLTPTDTGTQVLTGIKSTDTSRIIVECPTASVSAVTYPTQASWACALNNMSQGKNRILVIAVDELGNQTVPIETTIEYSPLTSLSGTAANKVSPDIAILNNEIFVTLQDALNADVHLRRSADAGLTWQPTTTAIGQGYLPKIAVDNSGAIYVVLGGGNPQSSPIGDGGGIYLIKSTDKGATFGSAVNIGIGFNPAVAVSRDGSRVYVAWYRKEPNGSWTVQCRASSDSGKTFLPPVAASDADSTEIGPRYGLDLAATDDGKYAYCVFSRRYGNFWKAAFSRSIDYGATFDADQNINPEPHNGYNPQIACVGNSVYIIWEHDASGHFHIYVKASSNDGQGFSNSVRVDDGNHDTTNYKTPSIAVDGKGVVYAAFVDNTASRDDIYIDYSYNQGKDFQNDTAIDSGPQGTLQQAPQLAVNSQGALASVVWQDKRSGNWDIYVRNFKNSAITDWLKSQMGAFGFLDSFQDDGKDQANTYDQALAIISLTNAGDLEAAKRILDALKTKQNADGSWYSSYNPKTGDNTDAANSKYAGNVSWVIIAVNFYTITTADTSYVNMAKSAAEWLWQFFDNNPASPTYGSLTGGMSGSTAIAWRSTEHNIDAYSAFKYIQKISDDSKIPTPRNYASAADLIRKYLMAKMWDGSRFLTGWGDDSRSLDVNPLAILSLGQRPDNYDIRQALAWALENLSLQIDWDANVKGLSGFDEIVYYGQLPNKIWFEGTEQMVSAYNAIGKTALAGRFHKQTKRVQQPNSSVPYSTLGSGDWPRYNSVSSTCWFYFNECAPALNPFDAANAVESVLMVDDFTDALPNQNSLGFYTDDDKTCVIDEDAAGAHHLVWNASGAYWYSTLFGGAATSADTRLYKYLSFRIKSRDIGEDFILRLEDAQSRIDINIKDYVELSSEWQYVNIPLMDFIVKGFDPERARSIAFIFTKDVSGELWFDNLKFSLRRLAPFVNIVIPSKVYALIPAQFTGAASGDYDGGIVSYEWDFGDGAKSSEPNPYHTYLAPGVYKITLKIKDSDDLYTTAQKDITVLTAPLILGGLVFSSAKDDDLVYKGEMISIYALTTAVEGRQLLYRFKIDGALAQDYSSNPIYTLDTTNVSLGKHSIEYDVKDQYGNNSNIKAWIYVFRRPIQQPNRN